MLNEEVVTIVAETAPFWGPWTIAWAVLALGVFGVGAWTSAVLQEEGLEIVGVIVAGGLFFVGLIVSAAGVEQVEDNSLEKQLTQTVGIENLEYESKSFTGSIDGRYVKGALVPLGDNEYQVVELVTK